LLLPLFLMFSVFLEEQPMDDKPKQSAARAGQVDIAAVQDLVKLMSDNDLLELEYAAGDLSIRLSKRGTTVAAPAPAPVMAALPAAAPPGAAARPAEENKYLEIVSPMVGTFYAAGSPEASPFISVGSTVNAETVVCIIEAMKVFNEIKSGVAGKVVKVCRKNEENVEFGQVLFLVDPA
jgi:acetyl-CoA carboxylase biotin carboxyl carrier protein